MKAEIKRLYAVKWRHTATTYAVANSYTKEEDIKKW